MKSARQIDENLKHFRLVHSTLVNEFCTHLSTFEMDIEYIQKCCETLFLFSTIQ